ncbi:M20/M25/M40 family metallo-hydrolase [Acuticoccus mangrovi]|uniref:M20/M25/M40 family metallo-hydrolase n=1 Tax=Acuticoccus mangrovi TaxID=2796142 RepID=A0A934ILR7_9HYPH|nr:M20/M25/M40 family metallo-hydrolase [Acuticoccus mangrovi]MBJ3774726.1 M20/M25/M40 family metallo-hydrolase [Acuticoccus mangrovi]
MNEDPSSPAATAPNGAVAFLQDLVRLNTENPPGEVGEAMEWLAVSLEGRGFEVERHPVPAPFARHYGRSDVLNLIVRHNFGSGPTVALHAPMDTLPAGSGWRRDPFGAEIHDGLLHGRGARDSKADVAAYVAALEHLVAEPAGLSGTLELHLTADEETGGFLGPAFLLGHELTQPDAVIAAGTSYQVVVGQEGVLHLEVLVRGVQAHASRPEDGVDAMAATAPLLDRALEVAKQAPRPLTISTIEGGRGVNLVADRVRFTIDRRLAPDEDGEAVEAALIGTLEGAHSGPAELECRRLLLAEPVTPTPPSERLAEILSRHAEDAMGRPVPVVSAPVVSGARHYALAGIPTALFGVGPPIVGEGVDFTGDEAVSLADLGAATRAVTDAVAELLGRG